ncbi:MAG: DUF4442 domain-containing protein [Proteobacteria bacterium]|nr:DUF4442 domain-containing protein [Pseudomonadota bacterium]MCP4917253.1 DUF4442 domain-containing protein [Pseudomonadota bacterium]
MLNPVMLSGYMLAKLPLALMAGLRITSFDADHSSVSVPYGWRSQNPFRSTYFAALSMAAEMSTGALGLAVVEAAPDPVSMLITGMTGEFTKKATDVTTFTCRDGRAMAEAVARTLSDGKSVQVVAETIGTNQAGVEVARFTFTWSFKKKRRRS